VKRNEVVIDGRLLKRSALRYTPAGTPAIDVLIGHKSVQVEAGSPRKAQFEINATAIGEMALRMGAAKLSDLLQISGFLAARGIADRKLALHVVKVEPAGRSEI